MNPNSNQKRIAFGYERTANNRIFKHDGQAAVVQLIYQYYSEGKSLSKVKETLEGMNIPSPQNKKKWGKQALSNILSNEHYVGSEDYPAIITEGMFRKVQQLKVARTR